MAQYYTDFSGYTSDVAPSDWTLRFGSRTYLVRDDVGATGGKKLEITGAANLDFFTWDAIDSDANRDDSEVLVRFRVLSSTTEIRAVQRGSNNAGRDGYLCGSRPHTSTFNLSKGESGSFTDLGVSSPGKANLALNTWYYLSSIVRGGTQEIRVWDASGTRPATPDLSASDTAITTFGWIGLYSNRGGTVEVDTFAVGTNTDDAPTGPVSSGPTISSITDPVQPGDTVTLSGSNLDAVTSTTFAGVSVTMTSQTASQIQFTAPDAYANGLALNAQQTIQVTDGSSPDTINTTFNPPAAVDYSGTVSGYPPPDGQRDFAEDANVTAVDGDGYIIRDPSALIDQATLTDALTAETTGTGDFYFRLFDVSDKTDSSQGTWTTERTITVSETDTTAPTVTSVSVPAAGSYKAGDNLDFTVNWSEVVDVTGTPAINLTIGGSSRQANYVSGTGTSALLFRYAVQAGDNDADGIAVGTLTLDGGTIQDKASSPNAANLTLNSVGDFSGVLVDTQAPVISIIGGANIEVEQGSSYVDAGATAEDNVGGDLTGSIITTGTVDTNTLGQYTIDYDVTDGAGNVATTKTRTVTVVEALQMYSIRKMGEMSMKRSMKRSMRFIL